MKANLYGVLSKMILRLAVLVSLGFLAAAGPVTWDDSKCAQKCDGGSKFQYSEHNRYSYSYSTTNELQADRSKEMLIDLTGVVHITVISRCEMVLELSEINIKNDASGLANRLEKNPLPFSWNDGKIEDVCPHPDDPDMVNNLKKGIVSAFQNTMRTFEMPGFNADTDILGTCDTTYKAKEKDPEKFELVKTKNIPSCSNHLKGHTLLLASFYQSSSHRQHLPLLSNEKAACTQIVDQGIITDISCDETATFRTVSDYGYVVKANGNIRLKKLSVGPATKQINYKVEKRESLVLKYQPHAVKNPNAESEVRQTLSHICENSESLIKKEIATYVHRLVYGIRQMDTQSVENVYTALKNNEICNKGKKALTIYVDALRMASSGGSIALLSKLAASGEMSPIDSILWLTLLPFTSFVEEESVASAIPLLRKGAANRQTLLGVTALAYKYCSINPECESTKAIKDLTSTLKQFLGNKCSANNQEEETEILTALKSFGNLGYVGESANDLFDCALTPTNKISLRIAAIDAFRRSPCKEEIVSKLMEAYGNKNEHDEVRIAALVSLSKCPTREVFKRVLNVYSTESSNQVKVFTWSLLENIRTSQDPVKASVREYLKFTELDRPSSTDLTKFSRNFELSFFSEIFNLGISRDANIIHSADSFIPRSGNVAYKLNLFGNQLEPIEFGARVEDLEHILEKIFGPVGILSKVDVEELINLIPVHFRRNKRSAENYQSKIDALHERLGYERNKVPRGSAYVRIMGHELGLLHLNEESLKRITSLKASDFLKNIANLRDIDTTKNLLFLDVAVLFPSITGRAYKLGVNGTYIMGLKANGKIDLRQPSFPIPRADIDGTFQASLLAEESISVTIHSDGVEPGVVAEAALNAGLDYQVKLELKDGRLMHIKLKRNTKRSEIINIKRTLYYVNHRGKNEMEKPPMHNLNYCTKYIQKLTGARFCGSFSFPHAFDNGKFKIPFVREIEGSLVVEEIDPSMDGYEVLLEIPDFGNTQERRLRILFNTPNSAQDRKFSLDYVRKMPDESTCSMSLNLHTPFYSLDANGQMVNRDDLFRLSADATGDGRRSYSLNIDAAKVVKGARLVEYQPKITLSLPSSRTVEVTGTLVFSKGRKTQLSVNLESKSFASPLTIKGNLAREGESIDISSNWKLNGEFNVNAFSQIHRMHGGVGYEVGKGLFVDAGHHYEPDGRSYESITFNAKVENIKVLDRLSFSIDSQILFAEHQDLNTMLKWDFSFKPLHHFKNDFIFRYGENFEDDKHLVRFTVISALHGDFNGFQKLSIENKAGITISCFDFDKSAALTAVWDFVDVPTLMIEAGVKTQKDKEIKLHLNYKHTQQKPLKIATDFVFTYNTYKFKYRDEAVEIAPNEFQWKSVIEPAKGKEITTDFMYRIKNQNNFHHEIEGTLLFPGFPQPVKQKGLLKFSDSDLKFSSRTDFGRGSVYAIDLQLESQGTNELKLDMPFIEGSLTVDAKSSVQSVQADFQSKGKDNRRIILNGKVTPGDTNTLDLDVQWNADKNPDEKVNIKLTSSIETEDGIEKYIIGGSVNYVNSIEISGTISTDLINGPHFFRAEFSGNMEPMAIEIEHEIKDGHMNTVTRYLRSGVEKIRSDIKGKFIYREFSHIEIEGGILTSSPYKTFDGKSLFFRIMGDSNDETRIFISEYRMKFSPVIGYEGKIQYERKRAWPGSIKSNLLVSVHSRPLYEGNAHVEYGNGKYSVKTSFTPVTKKKMNFLTSFEHSTRFAAFHHSLSTSLKYLQTVQLHAVADLRNMEDATLHSNLDVNSHKLYDVNSTMKMRSMFDFDAEANLFSKITPSLKIFSKGQASGDVTKFDFNLNVDSKNVITGSGEMKKRKRGFNGDIVFKYGEKEILVLTLKQDGKGKHERNYLIKMRFPSRFYTANIKVNREKKGIVNYETKFCRNEELCIGIDATHKEYDNGDEWQITYRRGDIEFSLERIRESSEDSERFHTVIYKGDNRYGYDFRFGKEGSGRFLALGIILPSREIIVKAIAAFSLSKPRLKLELTSDGKYHPDRKLITDIRFENHLNDNNPSKLDITLSHPIFEKPVEIYLSGDYEPSSSKFFTAEGSLDYSTDPEDKLLAKMSLEEIFGGTDVMLMNIYHKDEQHLDFVIKMNRTSNSNENSFYLTYNWKDENNADAEAYMVASYPKPENRFYFVYQRPKLSYKLEGKMTSPDTLLNNMCEMDLESVYNGKVTKGKLVSNYETGCHNLTIIREGTVSRLVELCMNMRSRKMFSVISEGLDDESQWTTHYLLEVIQKDWNTIGFRQQIDPEFLGANLFFLTSFLDELDEAGVGSLPFYDSPRFKIIRRSFNAKILMPAKEFVIPEAKKFAKDMVNDATILQRALVQYYRLLPSLNSVREYIQSARKFVRSVAYEIWLNVYSYYENYVRTILQYVDKVRQIAEERCDSNKDCRSLVRSYETGGWKGLLVELKNLLLSLPGKIEEFLQNPNVEVRNYFRSAFNILKALLHPLTKYRCGEIVVKVVQLSYDTLAPRIQAFLSRVPNYYGMIKQRVTTNEYYRLSVELLKEGYSKAKQVILKIDYNRLMVYAKKYFEDYLSTLSPPSRASFVSVNAFNVERGILDVDLYSNVANKLGERIRNILWFVTEKAVETGLNYNYNTIIIKFKRGLDLDFIPPYDAEAVILGHQHFVTFDKEFYDFAGECSYLLTRDFEDGNFTLALKPKEGDKPTSILVLRGDTNVELTSGVTSVKIADKAAELPYITKHIAVTREGSTIKVDTRNGLQVKCNMVHNICTISLSGWYYGKTAGLLGTYNYEEYDEFKRPKGHIANSVVVHAKSWELKKGCKSNNLVPEVNINKNSDYYKLCSSHFGMTSSPLAACFSEVPVEKYFQLCLRYLASQRNQKTALCNVAAAYVSECENNYVELTLPPKCLTCDAPDGSKLEHGDKKKFENLNKKSSDTVFIIEDHECNKVLVQDLTNLARSIERELQNEGYTENMFAVIGYGGDKIGNPQIFTAKDKIFFSSRDISAIAERFEMENKKVEASKAFESIKHAVTYLTRSDTAKSFVLLSCSACKYDFSSLQYPVVQQILLERGISLHVIKDSEIPIRKSSHKERNIIGVDPDTVFHTKDVTQRELVGERNLRSYITMPKDLCVALSQDVNGSYFSTHPISKASSSEVKNWRSVFARKFLRSSQLFSCQMCDCTSTRDHLPNTVCQPCEVKRPRLPFSVGSANVHTRTLQAFISYLIHLIRE